MFVNNYTFFNKVKVKNSNEWKYFTLKTHRVLIHLFINFLLQYVQYGRVSCG